MSKSEMSKSEFEKMRAELELLKSENEKLKKSTKKGVTMKVSQKGALSLYGLGRFPVTLYKGQWEVLLEHSEEIKGFIVDHKDELLEKTTLTKS